MSENYEQFAARMEERFPKMYAGHYGGFAIGEGWYTLIEKLSEVIQNRVDHIQKQGGDCPQVVVEQVKEKFGTLRFYYEGGDDFIHGAAWLAENISGQLCETCGAPGERRGGGWIRTLCDHHEQEHQQAKANNENS